MEHITGKHSYLYSYLNQKKNKKNHVYVHDEIIASQLDMSTATLTRYLRHLEENGLISRDTKRMKTSKGWKSVRVITIFPQKKK